MESSGAAPTSPVPGRRPHGIELSWVALAVLLPAVASLAAPMRMVDLAYQLRVGEAMLDTGTLLRTEILSFVDPGGPWLNQQWLAQVILALPYRAGGFDALIVLRAASIGAMGTFLFLACRARGATRTQASWLAIAGGVIASPSLALRPQLLGAVLFATTLWLLASGSSQPRRTWWLVAVGLLWANIHGSFALLPAMVGFAVLEARLGGRHHEARRLLVVGVVATAATLLTPYGPSAWRYVAELLTNPDIRERITEWAPITLGDWEGWLFLASGVVVTAVLLPRRPLPWVNLLWVGSFFALAWTSRRGLVWWGLVAAWILAGRIRGTGTGNRADRRGGRLHIVVIGSLAAGAVVLSPWVRGVALEDAPAGLAVAVRDSTQPGARLLVAQRYASWFELATPDRPVFVDSRIERFPSEVWDEYAAVSGGDPEWTDVVERWNVDAIVADAGWPIVAELRADPGWEARYRDVDGWVFVRT